jgi:hypothetical protein
MNFEINKCWYIFVTLDFFRHATPSLRFTFKRVTEDAGLD